MSLNVPAPCGVALQEPFIFPRHQPSSVNLHKPHLSQNSRSCVHPSSIHYASRQSEIIIASCQSDSEVRFFSYLSPIRLRNHYCFMSIRLRNAFPTFRQSDSEMRFPTFACMKETHEYILFLGCLVDHMGLVAEVVTTRHKGCAFRPLF